MRRACEASARRVAKKRVQKTRRKTWLASGVRSAEVGCGPGTWPGSEDQPGRPFPDDRDRPLPPVPLGSPPPHRPRLRGSSSAPRETGNRCDNCVHVQGKGKGQRPSQDQGHQGLGQGKGNARRRRGAGSADHEDNANVLAPAGARATARCLTVSGRQACGSVCKWGTYNTSALSPLQPSE